MAIFPPAHAPVDRARGPILSSAILAVRCYNADEHGRGVSLSRRFWISIILLIGRSIDVVGRREYAPIPTMRQAAMMSLPKT